MTEKTISVTKQRDTSGVTDRDASRAHALLKEGCHAVTVRDVTQRSVTEDRDRSSVTQGTESRRGMRRTDYLPGSLQNRIRQFFIANPDEELTYLDIVLKFGCTHEQAQAAVRELIKRDGKLTTVTLVRVLPADLLL